MTDILSIARQGLKMEAARAAVPVTSNEYRRVYLSYTNHAADYHAALCREVVRIHEAADVQKLARVIEPCEWRVVPGDVRESASEAIAEAVFKYIWPERSP